ncbi:MAG: tetratricopeptide repeat protein [Pseudomonadota bacterium]
MSVLVLAFGGELAGPSPTTRADAAEQPILLAQAGAAGFSEWQRIKDSRSAADVRAFLAAYPDSVFVPLARLRLGALTGTASSGGSGARSQDLERAFRASKAIGVIDRDGSGTGLQTTLIAADSGDARSQYRLARLYRTGEGVPKDNAIAAAWYLKSAEAGYDKAQFWIAYLYGKGRGVTKDDTRAVYWYRQAAAQGHDVAMYNLGIRYQGGRGVSKDLKTAASWFRKSSDAGNVNALSGLGYMYKHGRGGVRKNVPEAVRLFKRAADAGNAYGRYNLGLMYEDGLGVRKDRNKAIEYYRLAAPKDKRAARRLSKLGVSP